MIQNKIAWNRIEKVRLKYTGRNKNPTHSTICRALNKIFKNSSVRFIFCNNNLLARGVSGHYNPKPLDAPRYEIFINVKSINHKKLYEEIYLTLVHEYRHGYQARRSGHKDIFNKSNFFDLTYMMDKQEIDAYAMEAAESIKLTGASWVKSKYKRYSKNFSPQYKRFLKKLYKNLHPK